MSIATLGNYELLHRIAAGGMAELFVARTRGQVGERLVVVKRLLPEHATKTEYLRMFEDEARIAAAVNHPNVVQMYDYGVDAGSHYLAMEYLHGEDVRTLVKLRRAKQLRIPIEHVVNIMLGLCAGLHSVHEARGVDGAPLSVVHRDVSPQNLFVTFDGSVKLVDFGIAQAQNRRNETRHGALKGKVPYMSPEQLRGERVDRRTDLYAAGVLLYELTIGSRPYVTHTQGGGEFALMMAIAQGHVRRPAEADPDYPPELAQIVERAMARDPRKRYQTAREMQVDLEAYARGAGLATSTLALAGYMESELGARVEAWRLAQAGGKDLAALVVAVEEERSITGVREPDSDVIDLEIHPTELMASPLPDLSAAGIDVVGRRVEGVHLVSLGGRLNEGFHGAALGGALDGVVVLDLARVERITSYGVREWLEMLTAARGRASLYFCRCSEAVVNQLAMIRGFSGDGVVVSFVAPYLCRTCGATAERVLDCQRDAALLVRREAPVGACAICGGESRYDDDASALAFAVPYTGASIPPDVRAAADALFASTREPEAVEKLVVGNVTRVRVRSELGQKLRWNRIFDGIEGELVIDLQDAARVPPDGVSAFVRALMAMGPEVSRVDVNGAPASVAEAIAVARPARVKVATVLVEGHCDTCGVVRSTTATLHVLRVADDRGEAPAIPCRRCGTPLRLAAKDALARVVSPGDSLSASTRALPAPTAAPHPAAPPRSPRAARARSSLKLVLASTAGVVGLGLFALVLPRAVRSDPHGTVVAASPPRAVSSAAAPVDQTPAWAARDFTIADGSVYLVGRGIAPADDRALEAAQANAIHVLVDAIRAALPDGAPKRYFAQRAADGEHDAIARRYLRQVGATATPERVDVRMRGGAGAIEALARYRLPEASFREVVATYARAVSLDGTVIASAFPSFETPDDALVVVAIDPAGPAARAHVTPGDVVLRVDGRALSSPAGLGVLGEADRPHTLLVGRSGAFRTLHAAHSASAD
jgi:eukaryotic-like serine/threonine-protein kinase